MQRLHVFIFFVLASLFSVAQEVRVEAVLDSSRMRIGEQVKVNLYVTYDARLKNNLKLEWPSLSDTLTDKVDVISVSPIDTTFPNKSNSANIFQHQQITVSVYDSGYFAIPPFKFIVNGDSAHPLYTRPLFLEVHTVPTDTSITKLKDIKPPFKEEFSWKWYASYLYFGLAVLAVGVILYLLYRRMKNKPVTEPEPEKPRIPPHITALQSLEKIRNEQVWKEGRQKEYYSSITDTIRLYIEERFKVHALESTTDEIMTAFRSQVIDQVSREKLQQLLMLSDLVKFAKLSPVEAENNITLDNAFDFVNGTKREEEIVIPPANEQERVSE